MKTFVKKKRKKKKDPIRKKIVLTSYLYYSVWEDRNGRCNDLFTGNGGWEKADAGCRIVFFSLAFLYKEFLFFRVCVWAAKKRNWIPQPAAPFFFSNNCTIHFCTWKSTPDDRREHVDRENRLNQHTNIPECRLKCRLLGSSTYNNIFFRFTIFSFFFFFHFFAQIY